MNKNKQPDQNIKYQDNDDQEDYEDDQDAMQYDVDESQNQLQNNQSNKNKQQVNNFQQRKDQKPNNQQRPQQRLHTNSDDEEEEDDGNFYSERGGNSLNHNNSKKTLNPQNTANKPLMNSTATFEQNQEKNQTNKIKNERSQPIKAKQPINSPKPMQQKADSISIDQMSDINHKLKEELSQLIERLEMALNKFRERKEKDKQRYGINSIHSSNLANVPEDLMQKERDLKNATNRAQNVKKEILKLKRKLETNIDINLIIELENEIKNKEQQLVKLEDQNNQIKKVGMNQQRAMEDLNKEEELQQQLSHINMQMRQVKADTRQIQEQYKEIDKQIQEEHKVIYDLEERNRKITTLIQLRKRKNPTNNQQEPADPDDLLSEQELEEQIKVLEDIKEERERKAKRQIAEIDKLLAAQREEQEINDIKLRDKDQQLKNAELKIKELKRQIQVLSSKNNQDDKSKGGDDQSQGNNQQQEDGGEQKMAFRKQKASTKRQQQQQNQQIQSQYNTQQQ